MPVVGMGGYFFRAKDPETLKAWYRENLAVGGGMGADAKGESNPYLWYQQSGPTVFEPFKADSDYFPADRSAMINLRVSDLKGLLENLRGSGIEVTQEQSHEGMGSFARIHDPEGNPIELWEPPAD
jgi:predicted enzyme related to lactoylglutathione lyase